MKKPTFILKPSAYKTDKLYAITPGNGNGDMTVSSYVGNGTRINKDGLIESVATDTPRIDYRDGVGVLLEPTRTNAATYSGAMTAANGWTNSNFTENTANTIAPDGTLSATLLTNVNDATVGSFARSTTYTSTNAKKVFSFFVKFRHGDAITLQLAQSVTLEAIILTLDRDKSITVVTDASALYQSSSCDDYGDGWLRFSIVLSGVDVTDTAVTITFYGSVPYTDATDSASFWLWGLQVEQGNFPTSYIPTTTVALQRLYDEITLTGLITPTSTALISDDYHSVHIDVTVEELTRDQPDTFFIVSTTGEGYIMSYQATELYPLVGITTGAAEYFTPTKRRNRFLWTGNDSTAELWANGTKELSISSDINLTGDTITLQGKAGKWKLHEMVLWDEPLTDTEAQAITR